MKKIIFSIAALTAIVVMGSCSNDSDLTNSTVSSETVGDVTVSLNINPGVKVSESNSSMAQSTTGSANKTLTRAAITRADASTSSANANNPTSSFTPTLPSSFTAYFVATTDEGDYKAGEIVRTATVSTGSNSLKIPAIQYKIYVTNYTPSANITGTVTAGTSTETTVSKDSLSAGAEGEWNLERLEANLPTSSTTLYLFGDSTADFSTTTGTTTATVRMVNHYAAVCVAHNDFVNAVAYDTDSKNANNITTYNDGGSANWYNLYIRVNSVVSDAGTTNSSLTLANIAGLSANSKTGDGKITETTDGVFTFLLDKTIAANNIYQYTINDNYSGGANLTVTATAFNGTPISDDLSVY
ncbi:MAG: hypothetical protein LKK10_11810 [Prevotella sp.]|nr:hypothetical protein [Prevotella sp.]MCI2088938.1 hypothetical protein [Prevotella sp.]